MYMYIHLITYHACLLQYISECTNISMNG